MFVVIANAFDEQGLQIINGNEAQKDEFKFMVRQYVQCTMYTAYVYILRLTVQRISKLSTEKCNLINIILQGHAKAIGYYGYTCTQANYYYCRRKENPEKFQIIPKCSAKIKYEYH